MSRRLNNPAHLKETPLDSDVDELSILPDRKGNLHIKGKVIQDL